MAVTAARPYSRVKNLSAEFADYFLRRPTESTLIPFRVAADRDRYHARIRQRVGSSVDRYAVLNIHRIGIRAPALFVWQRTLDWGPSSECWPFHIAPVQRRGTSNDVFDVCLFHLPLFTMKLERRQDTPGALDSDNPRFLLYRCVGGYPMGLFCIYVRSGIPSEGEREATQVFFVVAFDFYGRAHWSRRGPLRWLWERVHNRVTGNVLNRFKNWCEVEFAEFQAGEPSASC